MVSIDKVYQKVLAIANKEQRGYITPQEFNLFADQAQMEIFEQYFYDLQRHEQRVTDGSISELIQSKIEYFKSWSTPITHGSFLPDDTYRVIAVQFTSSDGKNKQVEKLDRDEANRFHHAIASLPLLKPNESRPIYYIAQNKILFHPTAGNYRIHYIKKPKQPNWTYLLSTSENPLFNPTGQTQDFELHLSEESNLVIKILQLSGISMKDYNLTQLAGQKETIIKQQENL